MTTAAPKLPRSRWLKMRATPKRFPVNPPRQIGPGLFQFRDGKVYSRRLWPATPAVKANTRLWPNRKAKPAKPERYDGMVRVRRGGL